MQRADIGRGLQTPVLHCCSYLLQGLPGPFHRTLVHHLLQGFTLLTVDDEVPGSFGARQGHLNLLNAVALVNTLLFLVIHHIKYLGSFLAAPAPGAAPGGIQSGRLEQTAVAGRRLIL